MVLSIAGVLPGTSSVYVFLQSTAVSIGIVLILLSVDLRSMVQAGPSMLAAFALGAVGTATGAIVAGLMLQGAIGDETWKCVGSA